MNSQMQISDLENIISEKIFIKIEKWNLYLGDAGLARNLALCEDRGRGRAHTRPRQWCGDAARGGQPAAGEERDLAAGDDRPHRPL